MNYMKSKMKSLARMLMLRGRCRVHHWLKMVRAHNLQHVFLFFSAQAIIAFDLKGYYLLYRDIRVLGKRA